MSSPTFDGVAMPSSVRVARVLRVEENRCDVWTEEGAASVSFAAIFPKPRVERVAPGHLVALAARPGAPEVIIWRWYDAVVLGPELDGTVQLWEPGHGEVLAKRRPSYGSVEPGARIYASSGLPGAEWWAAGQATGLPGPGDVDLDEAVALYTENELWQRVFAPGV